MEFLRMSDFGGFYADEKKVQFSEPHVCSSYLKQFTIDAINSQILEIYTFGLKHLIQFRSNIEIYLKLDSSALWYFFDVGSVAILRNHFLLSCSYSFKTVEGFVRDD
uniref:Tyrosine-protein kinase JAK2 n=1 Tax=Anthurium amnicola TaxID=1678845 RepID=A0A1D1YZE0_9ARAE